MNRNRNPGPADLTSLIRIQGPRVHYNPWMAGWLKKFAHTKATMVSGSMFLPTAAQLEWKMASTRGGTNATTL